VPECNGGKIKSKGVPSSAQQINRSWRSRFAVKYNIIYYAQRTSHAGKTGGGPAKADCGHTIYIRHPAATGSVHNGRPSNAHSLYCAYCAYPGRQQSAHDQWPPNNNTSYYYMDVVWR